MYYLSTGQEKHGKKKSPELSFGALWFLPGPLCGGVERGALFYCFYCGILYF